MNTHCWSTVRLVLVCLILPLPWAWAQSWPVVENADGTALKEHLRMLTLALKKNGGSWSASVERALGGADGDPAVLQRVLDGECIAALTLPATGPPLLQAAPHPPALMEQGWRSVLVKVINEARQQSTLRWESPNAGPLPNTPKERIAERWLGIDFPDSPPLLPNLSGERLEYRMVHLWSDAAGERLATLIATMGNASGGGMQRWDFGQDAGGWKAEHDCTAEVRNGALKITPSGIDPQLRVAVKQPAGEKLLRFHARNSGSPAWEVFWMTTDHPEPDAERKELVTVFQDVANGSDYSVRFRSVSELSGLRIDPGNGGSACEIENIELIALDPPGPIPVRAEIRLQTEPSHEVTFDVRDEMGLPTMASFVIKDSRGRVYPWPVKRLAPDFFFHEQIYRGTGEQVRLPAGSYTFLSRRGPESLPEQREVNVAGPVTLAWKVKRWIDPASDGWYSGDHHIHAAGCQHYTNPTEGVLASDMQRHITGEDLKVGCNLTWGPCFDFQKQFFTGRIDEVSNWPYLLRYDVEVSGFGSHQSGHLCLLRLKEQIIPGGESKLHWPTLGLSTLRWAKAQGAICGPAHSANGLAGDTGRVPWPDGPGGLPSFVIPRFDGIGAMEYVADITQEVPGPDGKLVPAVDFISTMDTDRKAEWNLWYHTLNCGYRVRASGETDFPCITGDRVGGGRVYVKQHRRLNFDEWCEGIREGRSYVSDGTAHLMDFAAGGVAIDSGSPDLALEAPGMISATVRAAYRPGAGAGARVELIVNGYPVASQEIPADGQIRALTFGTRIERTSWVSVRIFPQAHTNPVFVQVAGKPMRYRPSLEWMLRAVDQCWKMKEPTYLAGEKAEASALYEAARVVYRQRLAEAE